MADDAASSATLGSIIDDAFKFATPFAQATLAATSTPNALAAQRLKDASLNGSGPNDPTLANQAPNGLWDFILGRKGATQGTEKGGGGLTNGGGVSTTFIVIAAIAIIAVFVLLRK
jgi:hypothetical protein